MGLLVSAEFVEVISWFSIRDQLPDAASTEPAIPSSQNHELSDMIPDQTINCGYIPGRSFGDDTQAQWKARLSAQKIGAGRLQDAVLGDDVLAHGMVSRSHRSNGDGW
jgi:hypothetical protein